MKPRTIYLDTPTRKGMALAAINEAPANFEAVIRERIPPRTLAQNRCSWAIYGQVSKDTGNSPQVIHDYCLAKYGGVTKVEINGFEFEVLNEESSKFGVKKFSHYLDWLIPFATTEFEIDARTIRLTYRV